MAPLRNLNLDEQWQKGEPTEKCLGNNKYPKAKMMFRAPLGNKTTSKKTPLPKNKEDRNKIKSVLIKRLCIHKNHWLNIEGRSDINKGGLNFQPTDYFTGNLRTEICMYVCST